MEARRNKRKIRQTATLSPWHYTTLNLNDLRVDIGRAQRGKKTRPFGETTAELRNTEEPPSLSLAIITVHQQHTISFYSNVKLRLLAAISIPPGTVEIPPFLAKSEHAETKAIRDTQPRSHEAILTVCWYSFGKQEGVDGSLRPDAGNKRSLAHMNAVEARARECYAVPAWVARVRRTTCHSRASLFSMAAIIMTIYTLSWMFQRLKEWTVSPTNLLVTC